MLARVVGIDPLTIRLRHRSTDHPFDQPRGRVLVDQEVLLHAPIGWPIEQRRARRQTVMPRTTGNL